MNSFIKTIGVLFIIFLGLASLSFTDTVKDQVSSNLGPYFIGSFSIFYALTVVYLGSFSMFWGSFWGLSRGTLLLLAILSFVFFGALLNNSSLFVWFKPPVFILAAPVLFYLFAAMRFFKRYLVGHNYVQLFKL